MVKYAFGFPVVAMVNHIPVKSRITGNDVSHGMKLFHRCLPLPVLDYICELQLYLSNLLIPGLEDL